MLIKFSRKKWLVFEQSLLFECWYVVYRKVWLCFYREMGCTSIRFFDQCKSEAEKETLLERVFPGKKRR